VTSDYGAFFGRELGALGLAEMAEVTAVMS